MLTSVNLQLLPGWNDAARDLKDKANFWYQVWIDAGSPSSGVLTTIKKKSKSCYKYEVRRLKRRQEHIVREKIVSTYSLRNKKNFWKQVKQLRKSSQTPVHHRIDGIVDDMTTSEVFRNKLSLTLNKYASHPFNPTSLTQDLDSSIYHTFSSDTVFEAIQHLKRNKKDDSNLVSNHFIIAAPVINC